MKRSKSKKSAAGEAQAVNLDQLITRPQLARLWGCSTKTLKRREQRGELQPIVLNPRVTAYRRAQVDTIVREATVTA